MWQQLLILIFLSPCTLSLDYTYYDSFMELVGENERGLFPNIFNLATNAIIKTNATCGQSEPESYCKLVEHVFLRAPQCDICDDNNPSRRHPIQYAIDGTNNWWQSPSLAKGLQYETVTISLDLRQQYQVAYVILKSGIAPRPGTWVLERSIDGETWMPWQFFATTDMDCERMFGMEAMRGNPRFTNDEEVICTSLYSKLDPLENGEVHISLVNGRPGVSGPSKELQAFTRARYVRIRLLRLRTLNADLMIITRGKEEFIDESVTRRYFYAIKDISIGGQCICYGHAETCPVDPATGQLRCECRHNTCGESCETCCPLFNQRLWRQGTNVEPHVCEPCQCYNHADKCEYNEDVEREGQSMTPDGIYEGGGVCVDCKHNTVGINCEMCMDTYYRPSGTSHYSQDPCLTCDCDATGSKHENCVKDETQASDGRRPGDCICKEGFGGRRCDRCAEGYRNYPECEQCPCNKAGSKNYATCAEKCECKTNVEGETCDRCKAGYINLDERNSLGCQECYCFGMSDQCTEVPWGMEIISQNKNQGWNLTDTSGHRNIVPKSQNGANSLTFNSKDITDRVHFWRAPKPFTGNLLTSYGGTLKYFVYYVPEQGTAEEGPPIPLPDVIIEGNGARLEYNSRQEFFARENVSVQVRLHELEDWYDAKTNQRPISKQRLMTTLAAVDNFFIRAAYHEYQVQSSLYSITLEGAEETAADTDNRLANVEQCTCPPNYVGLSCESCRPGYRRVNNQLLNGKCEECSCNDHSMSCDPYTAACLDCQHNTTGPMCQLCLPGYYGNPSLGGVAGACKQCACPMLDPSNNFSPSCSLSHFGTTAADEYICTACLPGYSGPKCESCIDGYYGDPMKLNDTCKKCECNHNIDPAAVGNCDRKTGECKKCIGNTAGWHCEKCKDQNYGNALMHDCRACNCHIHGAVSLSCGEDGVCECNPNYVGQKCDRCDEGRGDVENGCPECNCNKTGSMGDWCDPASGQCQCRKGVFGKQCDTCRTGYFAFSDQGCTCKPKKDGMCDTVTGQCICRPNVKGQSCNECEEGFFNISSKQGCLACDCHPEGATDTNCDVITGLCLCKQGVGGLKCDICAPNHFGLSDDGCKECPSCPAQGQVCHPDTGECVCPPNTEGDLCERCSVNAWDHHPLEGCKLCDCKAEGADGKTCDPLNGQCKCKKGYAGLKCDQCQHGHFEYPRCAQCQCDMEGTDPSACNEKFVCSCDEKGQCPCKANVQGKKCKKCSPESFSLQGDNPEGCFSCFCFQRFEQDFKTAFCVQATYIWQSVFSDDRLALFMEPYNYWDMRHGLRIFPDDPSTVHSYPTDSHPLYWPTPTLFHGDKVTSYNGFLRFTLSNTGGNYMGGELRPDPNTFREYPLVVLVGNDRLILEYYPKADPPEPEDGRYRVKLREDLWTSRTTPHIALTRKQLMIALQRVQAIYIRGTFNRDVKEATLSAISLDVAGWDNTTTSTDKTAFGVESCGSCPTGYAGTSCQNPDEGYCRKRDGNRLNSEEDLDLVGISEACACHGHSLTCDSETCRCTGCDHNTGGEWCNVCEEGFYGDATKGTPNDCTKCACPLEINSFSKTCYARDYGKGYVCDACQPGYTGMYCESCLSGYYGDPTVEGGSCRPCECHEHGSLSRTCDPVTGQCQCRHGVTGRDCSDCQPRHALIGADCRSCDQGCTEVIMMEVDKVDETISAYNFSGLIPVPWKRLGRTENKTLLMDERLTDFNKGAVEAQEMIRELGGTDVNRAEAEKVFDQCNFVLERIELKQKELGMFKKNATLLTEDMHEAYNEGWRLTELLKNYALSGGRSGRPRDVTGWVDEAARKMNGMKERDEYLEKRFNRAEMELIAAKQLLERIQTKKLNETIFETLHGRMGALLERIEDAYVLGWDVARKERLAAKNITTTNQKQKEQLEAMKARIENKKGEAEDILQQAEEDNLGTGAVSADAFTHYTDVNITVLDALRDVMNESHFRANQLSELLVEYLQKYVYPSNIHANDLEVDAARVRNAFISTKDASEYALQASVAYNRIVEGLTNATRAANSAQEAAENTYQKAYPENKMSLVETAEGTRNESSDLLMAAEKQKDTAEVEIAKLSQKIGDITDKVAQIKNEKIKLASTGYAELDEMSQKIGSAETIARNVKEESAHTEASIKETVEMVDQMQGNIEDIATFNGQGFRDLADNVNKTKEEVQKAKAQLTDVKVQAEKNEEDVKALADKIAKLKEDIQEAREKAARIHISVKSGGEGECVRTYKSPISPTPVNTITLKYRPLKTYGTQPVENSLIFLSRTRSRRSQPSEYLALEVRDQRFVFHWDIGAGDHMLTHYNENLQWLPNPREWYQVSIKRSGNSMSLTVGMVKVESGVEQALSPASTVNVTYEEDPRIFNTRPSTTLISLGANPDDKPPNAAASAFKGTVGELIVGGQKINLWNFDSNRNFYCEGDVAPDNVAATDVGGYLFRNGYAEVPSGGSYYDSARFSISIQFAAYSPNGLLYFRGDEEKQDFVSVELQDGHVVLQFNLGGDSYLKMESSLSYNDGEEHTVHVQRDKLAGTLSIDGEDVINAQAPGKHGDLNIANAVHSIGGVPASRDTSVWNRFNIAWSGFFGCIKAVNPDVTNTISPLNLQEATKTLNAKPGCSFENERLLSSDRVVSLRSGPKGESGYFVITAFTFSPSSSFAFGFRTKQENATLLYQSSRVATYRRRVRETEGSGFISAYLYGGSLVVILGTDSKGQRGEKVATLRTQETFHDGLLHSVFIERTLGKVSLLVDDRMQHSADLSDQSDIGSDRGQLFLGGLPRGIRPDIEEMPTTVIPLVGCIADLFTDYQRMPLVPETHAYSEIGVCKVDDTAVSHEAEESFQADSASRDGKRLDALQLPRHTSTVSLEEREMASATNEVIPMGPQCPPPLTPQWDINVHHGIPVHFGYLNDGTESYSEVDLKTIGPRRYSKTANLTIGFSFRTSSPDGLLFYWGNKKFQQYFTMSLTEGRLAFQMQKGANISKNILTRQGDRFDDDLWHTVTMVKLMRTISLSVDEVEYEVNRTPTTIRILRRRFFVGGFPDKLRERRGLSTPNFRGCIRDFTMGERPLNVIRFGKAVIPCDHKEVDFTSKLYLHPSAQATYDISHHKKEGDFDAQLNFRTSKANVRILTLSGTDQYTVDVLLKDAQTVTAQLRDGRVVVSESRVESETFFCDGAFHSLEVHLGTELVLSVDEEASAAPLPPDFPHSFTQLHIADVSELLKGELPEMGGVRGCMSDLRVKGRYLELKSMRRAAFGHCPALIVPQP